MDFNSIVDKQKEQIAKSYKTDVIEKAMTTENTPHKEKLEGRKDDKIDDFKHHRLMAGFHAMKQKESSKKGMDLHSSSNPDINKDAKGSDGEAKRHQTLMEQHLEKAKSLHKKDTHGEWNKTIPTSKDAMEYGNMYAEKVDKGVDSKEAVKDSKIKKSIDDGIDILKGGVGSGRKIGIHLKNSTDVKEHNKKVSESWVSGDNKKNNPHNHEIGKIYSHPEDKSEFKYVGSGNYEEQKSVLPSTRSLHSDYAKHLESKEEKKDRLRFEKRISLNGKDISKSELETLSKSDLIWQLNQEQFNTSKKGSELITLANGKLARLNEQKTLLLTQLGLNREGIVKLKSDFTFPADYSGIDYDSFKRDELGDSYDSMYKFRNDYNSCCYAIKNVQDDITFLTTFINNLEAGKTYKLSVQQINTLEKAEEQDLYKAESEVEGEDDFKDLINKADTDEKKKKVKKVMDEWKSGD